MATAAATQNGTAKPAPAPAAPAKPASRLAKVQKGRLRSPNQIVIYGPEGVGKSTLAYSAPNPIVLDIEDGSSELEVARYPFRDGIAGHRPRSFVEVLAAIEDLTVSEHVYKTLVIDTVDALEALLWRFMLERDSAPGARNPKNTVYESIEDYGFGKGYNAAVEEWRAFAVKLDRLRYAKGMDIVLVGHAQVKTFKNPEGEDYDRYQLRVNDKAASFLKEWAKVVAFMCFEDGTGKTSKHARVKGFSTGRRILKTSRSAAVDAKSRLTLPEEVEVDIENPWAPFAAAIAASIDAEIPGLMAAIEAELARIGDDELTAKAKPAVDGAAEAKDTGALGRYLNDLRKRSAKDADAQ